MSIGWPVQLRWGRVGLRPLRYRDKREWSQLREDNRSWLSRWEATSPTGDGVPRSFNAMVRTQSSQARAGLQVPLAITLDEALVGQISINPLWWGSLRCGAIGYWVAQSVAGQGIAPLAVAMLTDHAMLVMGVHRIELNIRPENVASLRVAEKLGFRDEGLRQAYLHIDGGWRDHRAFALTSEELPQGLVARYRTAVDLSELVGAGAEK